MSSLRQFLGKLKGYLTPDDASYAADGGKLVTRGDNGEGQFATTSSTAVEGNASTNGNGGSFSSDSGVGSISASTTGIGAIIASEGGDVIQFYGNAGQVGGMSNAGTFSAVSFSGGGAGLTGLTSSQITDATSAATPSKIVLRGFGGEASFGSQSNGFEGDGLSGQAYSGNAVVGQSISGNGVYAESNSGTAFYGYSSSSNLMQLEGGSGVVFTVSNAGVITANGSGLTGLVSSQITDASSGDIDGTAANKVVKFSSGGDIAARVFSARSITIGGPSTGGLTIGNPSDANANLKATNLTTDRNFEFPDAAGTLALTTSNVATATALQTARSIGGSSFNGTADIEIDRAKATSSAGGTLQNLSGTTCFSWGAGSGQNITIPTGTGVSFNSTSYTFGTGSAAAFNTALGLTTLATTTPGTGVATWLATPSGANLASALTTALPASKGGTGLTALGTGVATALGVNVGSAGAFVTFNGAGGTPSSLTLTNATGLPIAGLVASTTTAIGVGSIELGHASDTTISRVSAGRIAVEGVNVVTVSSTDTLTNKTLTSPTIDAITTAGSMTLSGAGGSGLFGLKSTSSTGYSSMELLNFSGGQMGGFGYANSSAGAYADQVYFYSAAKALIIATAAGSRHMFLSTTGDLSIGSGAAANTKSVLDLTSTTKGFLPPRMTTTQRDAITSPPAGLMIYNTTTNKLNVYTTAWEAVTSA